MKLLSGPKKSNRKLQEVLSQLDNTKAKNFN